MSNPLASITLTSDMAIFAVITARCIFVQR